jgi:hypothetical protein
MVAGCWTNQPNCAGIAHFGPFNQVASFTIWHGNTGGRENFVLPAGQTHGTHVQSGDTYSSAWGNAGVPDNAGRNWIPVG